MLDAAASRGFESYATIAGFKTAVRDLVRELFKMFIGLIATDSSDKVVGVAAGAVHSLLVAGADQLTHTDAARRVVVHPLRFRKEDDEQFPVKISDRKRHHRHRHGHRPHHG